MKTLWQIFLSAIIGFVALWIGVNLLTEDSLDLRSNAYQIRGERQTLEEQRRLEDAQRRLDRERELQADPLVQESYTWRRVSFNLLIPILVISGLVFGRWWLKSKQPPKKGRIIKYDGIEFEVDEEESGVFGEHAFKLKEQEIALKALAFHEEISRAKMKDLRENWKMLRTADRDARKMLEAQQNAVEPLALPHGRVPTFAELLRAGEIAPGRKMILCFVQGQPRRGTFHDLYSAAIAGDSGSGKTNTKLFLIASGLIATGARFLGIDPHYPHPESLGEQTKPLWEAGLIEMGTDIITIPEICQTVDLIIERRLATQEPSSPPVVFIVDELAKLAQTTTLGEIVIKTMRHVSTEGRKCGVYMLASSQTWLAELIGGNSIARDTIASTYVHRIKPKQAQALLQDKNEVAKAKKLKDPGDVLFIPVTDSEGSFAKIPYTCYGDMVQVADLLKDVTPKNMTPLPAQIGSPDFDLEAQMILDQYESATVAHHTQNDHTDLRKQFLKLYKMQLFSYNKVAQDTNIPASSLHVFMNGSGGLKSEYITALQTYLNNIEQTLEVSS